MDSQEQQPRQEQAPPPPRSKPPIRLLVSRGYTIIVLLITLILPFTNLNKSNKCTTPEAPPEPPPQWKIGNIGSYPPAPAPSPTSPAPSPTSPAPQIAFEISQEGSKGSALTASALGAGCNLFQFGLLVYCMVTGKDLTRSKYNMLFNYYIDKAVAHVLTAGAGVGLGSLLVFVKKKTVQGSEKKKTVLGSCTFWLLDKISTSLLASAIISTSVSSSCSATAMREYKRTVENKRTLEKAEKAVGKLRPWAIMACNYCCEP